MIILAREFVISGIRWWPPKGRVIAADRWGKYNYGAADGGHPEAVLAPVLGALVRQAGEALLWGSVSLSVASCVFQHSAK
jgi:phosphatidylglycerophosphate synthase